MRKRRGKVTHRTYERPRKIRQGRTRRNASAIASISLDRVRSPLRYGVLPDDRRQFLPFPNRLPQTISGAAAGLTTQSPHRAETGTMPSNYQVRFVSPERVTVCIRRRRRREALFAKSKIGKGRPSPTKGKKPRRTRFSAIKCD